MEELLCKLKADIIKTLDLQDIITADFNYDTPLFVEGLALDSIDAIEIAVLLEKKYNIKVEDIRDRRTVFYSIRSIAEYIQNAQKN